MQIKNCKEKKPNIQPNQSSNQGSDEIFMLIMNWKKKIKNKLNETLTYTCIIKLRFMMTITQKKLNFFLFFLNEKNTRGKKFRILNKTITYNECSLKWMRIEQATENTKKNYSEQMKNLKECYTTCSYKPQSMTITTIDKNT